MQRGYPPQGVQVPPGQGPPPPQPMTGPPSQQHGPPVHGPSQQHGPPVHGPSQQHGPPPPQHLGPPGGQPPMLAPQQMRPGTMMPPPPPPGPVQPGQQVQATRTMYPPVAGSPGYQTPPGPPMQRPPYGGMVPPGQPSPGPGLPPQGPHVRMPPPAGYGPRSIVPPQSPGLPQGAPKRPAGAMSGMPPGPGVRMAMGPPNGPGHMQGMASHHPTVSSQLSGPPPPKKKKKLADKILPQKVRDLVPESQAYMDLLAFERKLDYTITRKRLDIQEALKRPMKHKRKLRIFISNTFFPGKPEVDGEEMTVPSWELRVEGKLIEDQNTPRTDAASKVKRKFSSFFKSLVIELDKDLYGPDNHLVEWHRTPTTQETDGFQVKRPGDRNVRCTILLLLDYQPLQFKLDPRLARLLGIHTQTRPVIINALWQYIKTHKLQDSHEREFINCDKYLEQIFECARMKFAEIPSRLHRLLNPPDPIVINHIISVEGPDMKKTACYDIDVEIDDLLKVQMNNFVLSTTNQQEIQGLDNKIHETVDTINQLKTNREFFLGFAKDPQQFIAKWLISQNRDLKIMTDVAGNPEEERRSDFFFQPWTQEGVCRYFYGKVQTRRHEVEQALGIRNT